MSICLFLNVYFQFDNHDKKFYLHSQSAYYFYLLKFAVSCIIVESFSIEIFLYYIGCGILVLCFCILFYSQKEDELFSNSKNSYLIGLNEDCKIQLSDIVSFLSKMEKFLLINYAVMLLLRFYGLFKVV